MLLRWLIASLHVLALPLGLGSVVVRAVALHGALDRAGLARVFRADSLWGAAALIWIVTGVWRAFFGLEKGTAYHVASNAFSAFAAVILLEVAPMTALIRWRLQLRGGVSPDTSRATRYGRISVMQAGLVVVMVFAATAMARGWFY